MAAKVKNIKPLAVPGDLWYTVNEITLDNSYVEKGMAVSLGELGFGPEAVHAWTYIVPLTGSEAEATTLGNVSYNGSKFIVTDYKTQKEIAAAKDLSKVKFNAVTFCLAA